METKQLTKKEKIKKIRLKILNNKKYFFKEFLGAEPWSKQIEIVKKLDKYQRVAVKSSNSCGKTWLISRIALRFLASHPNSKVINTAPSWKQIENQYWRELRQAHKESVIELGGKMLKTQLNFDDNWFAIGVASGDSTTSMENFQGWHGDHILFIVDEASGVPNHIFEAIEGSLANKNAKLLIVGNPTKTSGYFFDAFKHPHFAKVSMNAFDVPNVKQNKDVVPGLATKEWIEYMASKYGTTSDVYKIRVMGMFPSSDGLSFIGIDEIERAMHNDRKKVHAGQEVIGVDVARMGDDRTTLVWRHGNHAKLLKTINDFDGVEVARAVAKELDAHPGAIAKIDLIGVGAGAFDTLIHWDDNLPAGKKKGYAKRVFAVNVAKKPKKRQDRKDYFNERSRGWALTKKWLETGILDYSQEWDELAIPRYEYQDKVEGHLKIESKKSFKQRTKGKSPDIADALILTFQDHHEGGEVRLPVFI